MFDQDPAAPTIIFIANNALHFVAVEPGSSLSVQIVLDASSWSSGSVDAVAHSDALGVCVLLASPADSPTHHSVGNDVMRDVVVVDDGGGHDARSVIALVRADTGAVLCRYALGVHERPVCAMFLPAGSQCTLAVGVSALAHTEKGKGGAAGTASRTPEGRLLVFEWEHGRGLTLLASHATGGAVNAMCTLGDDTIVVGADKRVKVYRVVRSACDEDEEEEEEEEEPYSRNHSGKKKSSRDGSGASSIRPSGRVSSRRETGEGKETPCGAVITELADARRRGAVTCVAAAAEQRIAVGDALDGMSLYEYEDVGGVGGGLHTHGVLRLRSQDVHTRMISGVCFPGGSANPDTVWCIDIQGDFFVLQWPRNQGHGTHEQSELASLFSMPKTPI